MRIKYISAALLIPLFSLAYLACADDKHANRPLSGWRYSPSGEANFSQTVHYPATHINSGGHPQRALIMGDINAKPKSEQNPHQLIVNGVNHPLAVDQAGHYERPYAFGTGSNSLEIKDHKGNSLIKRQFYEANPHKTPAKIRIVLAWDSDHTDVDLHVVTPNGEHAWYGQRSIPSGGAIDIDATDGYGPEIFASPNAMHGAYQVYANYYGGNHGNQIITLCKVAIITNENTPNEKQQIFQVPLRKAGELTLVKSFMY